MIIGVWFKWDDEDKLPPADLFNNYFHAAYDGDGNEQLIFDFDGPISCYSFYRGWTGYDFGSIVWADIREYSLGEDEKPEFPDVMFVCGHTQLEDKPIIRDWVADLDVRRPFVLNTETGKITEYKSGE